MSILTAPRSLSLLGLLICCVLIAAAFYLQYVQGLEPCPLCMTQRLVIYALGIVFLLSALHNPGLTGQRVYAGLVCLLGLAGAGFAGRQLWLQSLPPDQVPACGPSLDYMLEVLPLQEVISVMMRGSGDCAQVQWQFLSLSIPAWTGIAFACFILLGILLWRRRAN